MNYLQLVYFYNISNTFKVMLMNLFHFSADYLRVQCKRSGNVALIVSVVVHRYMVIFMFYSV